jgi:deoxyribonuclease V
VEPAFLDAAALRAAQAELGRREPTPWHPADGALRVAGCFVAFARGEQGPGQAGDHAWVGAAVLDERGRVLAGTVTTGITGGPYVPGLLAQREGQLLLDGVAELVDSAPELTPDVVLVDATGRDHPRRCGLAVHLGYLWDLPTIGVTHRLLSAREAQPPALTTRGDHAEILMDGRPVAAWCCTRSGARPVVAHAAWRTDVRTAVDVVVRCSLDSRTPEPLRAARRLARQARAERD